MRISPVDLADYPRRVPNLACRFGWIDQGPPLPSGRSLVVRTTLTVSSQPRTERTPTETVSTRLTYPVATMRSSYVPGLPVGDRRSEGTHVPRKPSRTSSSVTVTVVNGSRFAPVTSSRTVSSIPPIGNGAQTSPTGLHPKSPKSPMASTLLVILIGSLDAFTEWHVLKTPRDCCQVLWLMP